MNKNMLATSVRAVPNRANQRIHSSLPRGKNTRPTMKTMGRKITTDIRMASNSIIGPASNLSSNNRTKFEIRISKSETNAKSEIRNQNISCKPSKIVTKRTFFEFRDSDCFGFRNSDFGFFSWSSRRRRPREIAQQHPNTYGGNHQEQHIT